MKVITLSSSTISYYLQCPEKWNLAYNENLRLVGEESESMMRGSALHKLLELYYIERIDKDVFTSAQNAIGNYLISEEAKLLIDQKFVIQRFRDYIVRYQQDDFTPIKLNHIPSTEVGFSHPIYQDDKVTYILEGKIDLISKIGQDLILVDHKSQGRYAELYHYRPQFLTYSLVSGIRQLVVNYIGFQKETKDITFRRSLIRFPEWMIERWREQVLNIFEQVEIGLAFNKFAKNLESCGGPFGSYPCQFAPICNEIHPDNKELIANVKQFKYVVKPYESWSLPSEEV